MELHPKGSSSDERRPLRHVVDVEDGAVGSGPSVEAIGWFGSFALVMNNISGPGMLDFPRAFQQAGWVPCVACIGTVSCVSAVIALYLADAHRALRSARPRSALEFSDVFGELFGRPVFLATQALYFLNLFSQNVAAIVATAQATDTLLVVLVTRSVAVEFHWDGSWPSLLEWTGCARDGCTPFDHEGAPPGAFPSSVLTAGYALSAALLAPLGFMSLRENMSAQKLSFVLLVVLCVEFLLSFSSTLGEGVVVPVGDRAWDVLGVVIFNFAFCVTIPSWLNEKSAKVDERPVIWGACLAAAVAYVIFGWLGGRAFDTAPDNVLDALTCRHASLFTRVCGGAFAFAIIGLGIPIFCVLMRYNLVSGGCNVALATLVAGALPWAASWLVYRGHGIVAVLSWSGLILNSIVDFMLPMCAALATMDTGGAKGKAIRAKALLLLVSAGVVAGLVLKILSGDPVR